MTPDPGGVEADYLREQDGVKNMKKTTKIMGAVLAVLFVAALFVGAAAAAETDPVKLTITGASPAIDPQYFTTVTDAVNDILTTHYSEKYGYTIELRADSTAVESIPELKKKVNLTIKSDVGHKWTLKCNNIVIGTYNIANGKISESKVTIKDLIIDGTYNAIQVVAPKTTLELDNVEITSTSTTNPVMCSVALLSEQWNKDADGKKTTQKRESAAGSTVTIKNSKLISKATAEPAGSTGRFATEGVIAIWADNCNVIVEKSSSLSTKAVPFVTAGSDNGQTNTVNSCIIAGENAVVNIGKDTSLEKVTGGLDPVFEGFENFFFKGYNGAKNTNTVDFKGEIINPSPSEFVAYVPYLASDLPVGTYYFDDDVHNPDLSTVIHVLPYTNSTTYVDGVEYPGTYQLSTDATKTIKVVAPDVLARATVKNDSTGYTYLLDESFVPNKGYTVILETITPAADKVTWKLTNVDSGSTTKVLPDDEGKINLDGKKAGEYLLTPSLVSGFLVPYAPAGAEIGTPFSFTYGKADAEKLVLSAESVVVGQDFVATITGLPGKEYTVTVSPQITIIPDQDGVTYSLPNTSAKFTMGKTGIFDLSLRANEKNEEATVNLVDADKEATIEITEGVLTAESEYDAYTIGADIELTGTYTAAEAPLYFYIEGVNIGFNQIDTEPVTGEEWEKTLKYKEIVGKEVGLDAGTYTIYVSILDDEEKAEITAGTYVAVPVALKQSFITITDAPTAVAQGEKVVIEGTANAAKSVLWYLFGTNYFSAGVQNVKNDAFKITIPGGKTDPAEMAAGQYFFVVQHPMYDELYNIAPENMDGMTSGTGSFNTGLISSILLNSKAGVYKFVDGALSYKDGEPLFDTNIRQTANAAQALCDALDTQNIDDMYAKASFIVGAPTSIINPIPAKIAQGQILEISGTTTGHAGEIVSVEFLATAFAAIPKEAVGTASFVTVNTKIQEDGTWAIEFDTSNLNADDYTVSVAVGSLGPSTSKITITKAGEPVPTQTTVPTGQPTTAPTTAPTQTPASPGFGILAALAGLGAVAVLLLRRQ